MITFLLNGDLQPLILPPILVAGLLFLTLIGENIFRGAGSRPIRQNLYDDSIVSGRAAKRRGGAGMGPSR
ncbi:hypothetical protein A6U92_16735 [Agrobacterium rubi]|nr:hypothetical protein A6U92_16735 [Agrobacterium rubi]